MLVCTRFIILLAFCYFFVLLVQFAVYSNGVLFAGLRLYFGKSVAIDFSTVATHPKHCLAGMGSARIVL